MNTKIAIPRAPTSYSHVKSHNSFTHTRNQAKKHQNHRYSHYRKHDTYGSCNRYCTTYAHIIRTYCMQHEHVTIYVNTTSVV